jgi:alpha-aminoadipic semialdehyde synthase
MIPHIGVRREDKNKWERRAPLAPAHVAVLVNQGLSVVVQPSAIRVFSDAEYRDAGAVIQEDLSRCPVVFAIKEIPKELFRPGHAYLFFTHTIKGQPYNMPLLQRALDVGCTMIDYEKVTDENDRRKIFFGQHAGRAGMIDSLWALGRRLKHEGIATPFLKLEQTYRYADINQARAVLKDIGREIAKKGLPGEIAPLATGFVGYGNVSQGAQDTFDLLPHREVAPDRLRAAVEKHERNQPSLIKVVFREEHTVRPKEQGGAFQLNEYHRNPELYETTFPQYLPYLSVIVNAIFWTVRAPRLIAIEDLRKLYLTDAQPRLRVIGDISCDVRGGIECTLQCTDPQDPVFVYRVKEDRAVLGVEGTGPVVLAVDNLPCELPKDASISFGDMLAPFVPILASTDYSVAFEELALPQSFLKAVITHRGALTPDFQYLKEFLTRSIPGVKP